MTVNKKINGGELVLSLQGEIGYDNSFHTE